MKEKDFFFSRTLGKTNLNKPNEQTNFYTFCCRTVNTKLEEWNVKEHAHSFFELHYCLCGNSVVIVDGKEYNIKPNTYLIIPPKINHQIVFESQDFCKFIWGFSLNEEIFFINQIIEFYKSKFLFVSSEAMFSAVKDAIVYADRKSFGAYRIVKDSLFKVFACTIDKIVGLGQDLPFKDEKNYVQLFQKFIAENLSTGVGVEQVATFFRISKTRLNSICVKECGMTFRQLKTKAQLERIRELLKDDELTMEQIATATGFSDRYAMSKFFKKNDGCSPGEYRLGLRK